jgi:hypothetical protein
VERYISIAQRRESEDCHLQVMGNLHAARNIKSHMANLRQVAKTIKQRKSSDAVM